MHFWMAPKFVSSQSDGYLQNFKAWFNHYCRLEATVDQELTLEDNFTSERLEL